MDSRRLHGKRLACVLSLALVLAAAFPSISMGFLGDAFGGLTSLGSCLGGPSACGDKPGFCLSAPVVYVGWMLDRNGTSYELSGGDRRVLHRRPLHSGWVGLSETARFGDNVGLAVSAWTLFQRGEIHTYELDDDNAWEWNQSPVTWYFLDGFLTRNVTCGFSGVAGFRFERYTSRYSNLRPVPTFPDTGDVKINSYMPLVGVQYNYVGSGTNLLVRTVGFPTVLGTVDFIELFNFQPLEVRGNYNSGYFLEVFSEYSQRLFGANLGLFGRWNMSHGRANASGSDDGSPRFPVNFSLQRTTWTVGGSLSFDFVSPSI